MVCKKQETMSSRDSILAAVKASQPSAKPLPVIDHRGLADQSDDHITSFARYLEAGGGSMIRVKNMSEVRQIVNDTKLSGALVLNLVPQVAGIDAIPASTDVLDELQQVFILGSLAVAENGAVWVPESTMLNRILPFISDQLFLVVNQKDLVPTMHEAYAKIRVDEDGFGVFIAGPSKTADIEQSLVIGAHGPRKMVVLMIEE
ncbi:MAG: lactate utilization protein B/C [Chitinophagaceae bacterium]|nr:MAG: lactate utilization protein B/C [Chitinophagaceae bacterium]